MIYIQFYYKINFHEVSKLSKINVNTYILGFPKDAIDYNIKKAMNSDILEITDNPQEYFITQEKPVSIVTNLTSSLKKLESNTEPKKSVTFRHDLITGKVYY